MTKLHSQIQPSSEAATEQVAAILRDRIVKGELAPFDRILDRRFSAVLDASRKTVYEMFGLFEFDDLVETNFHRDAVVSENWLEDAFVLFDVTSVREGSAAPNACENIKVPSLRRFEDLHDEMLDHHKAGHTNDYFDLNAVIHGFVVGLLSAPKVMRRAAKNLDLAATEVLLILVLFYLVMGRFLETFSMRVSTIPAIIPMNFHLDCDLVWFGIFLVILMELAMKTPPVKMNLSEIQSLRRCGELAEVDRGIPPFTAAMLMMVGLINLWPQIVMVLPEASF